MAPRPPAFLLRPLYVPKPWGGRRLETELHRRGLPPGPVGESWEASDFEEARSLVDGGPLDGAPLRVAYGGPFPLLLKVIDAREDLSVQVHPDGRDGPPAKEEAWAALAGGGAVAAGHVRSPLPKSGAWLARMERRMLTADPPTLVHVPPGTVHAILAGSLLFEAQTPVDVTWRLDDYDRPGLDGRPRPLHLREAAAVLERGPEAGGRVEGGGRRVRGKRLWLEARPPGRASGDLGCAAFLLAGGKATWSEGGASRNLDVPPGRTVILSGAVAGVESRGWMLFTGTL